MWKKWKINQLILCSFLCKPYVVGFIADSPENGKYNLIQITAVKVRLFDLCPTQ